MKKALVIIILVALCGWLSYACHIYEREDDIRARNYIVNQLNAGEKFARLTDIDVSDNWEIVCVVPPYEQPSSKEYSRVINILENDWSFALNPLFNYGDNIWWIILVDVANQTHKDYRMTNVMISHKEMTRTSIRDTAGVFVAGGKCAPIHDAVFVNASPGKQSSDSVVFGRLIKNKK